MITGWELRIDWRLWSRRAPFILRAWLGFNPTWLGIPQVQIWALIEQSFGGKIQIFQSQVYSFLYVLPNSEMYITLTLLLLCLYIIQTFSFCVGKQEKPSPSSWGQLEVRNPAYSFLYIEQELGLLEQRNSACSACWCLFHRLLLVLYGTLTWVSFMCQ